MYFEPFAHQFYHSNSMGGSNQLSLIYNIRDKKVKNLQAKNLCQPQAPQM